MRSVVALAVAWGVAACVPSAAADLEAPFLLVIETSSASADVRAWDASGKRFVAGHGPAATVHILGYARPLADEGIDVGPDRTVAVVRTPDDVDESWPIPPPLRWQRVTPDCDAADRACEPSGEASLPAELADLRLERAPCPARVVAPVAFAGSQRVSSVNELGDVGVLIGRASDPDVETDPPSLLLLEHGGRTPTAVAGPVVTATPAVLPLFVTIDGQLHLTWGGAHNSRTAPVGAFPVTGVGQYGPPLTLTSTARRAVWPVAIAAHTAAGRTTVAIMDRTERLLVGDDLGLPFARRAEGRFPFDDFPTCGGGVTTILELTGPRTGLVSFRRDRVLSFDLDRPTGVLGAPHGPTTSDEVCRSARAFTSAGDELIAWRGVFEAGIGSPGAVAWRRANTTSWEALRVRPGQVPLGGALAVRGDLIYAGIESADQAGHSVVVWQRDARRPDVRPRYCGAYPTPVEIRRLTATRDGVLVWGVDGGVAWILPDERLE